jgi:large subunit ribosomal protein L13
VDCGDSVIVINADKVVLTGRKLDQKTYYRHSGYMGGLKSITARKLLEKRPEDLVRSAVKGMLPKNRLGRQIFKNLKVYAGDAHPHEAQQPQLLDIKQ